VVRVYGEVVLQDAEAVLHAAGIVVAGFAEAGLFLIRSGGVVSAAEEGFVGGVMLFGGDAQRLEEGEVVAGEGAVGGLVAVFGVSFGLVFDFVEADGGFEHEEDVEALLADFADYAGDGVGLRDGLVNGFAKLLDKVFDLLIQCHLRLCSDAPAGAGLALGLP